MGHETPEKETSWGEELDSLLSDLGRFISIAKLKVESLQPETVLAWIENGLMRSTDIGLVVGTQLDGPISPDQLSQLTTFCEQLETQSVTVEVIKTTNDYGVVLIKPIIN